MMRLGFAARLAIIFVFSLMAIQLLVVMAFFMQRGRDTESGFRLPLPDQVAAIVQLLENSSPEQRPVILRAINSLNLRARLVKGKPDAPPPETWQQSEHVENVLRSYLQALDERQVTVLVETIPGPMNRQRHISFVSAAAIEVQVSLKTGETLVIDTTGILNTSIFGFPPGFFAGVLGFAISVLTVIIVRREAKPLRQLAKAVDALELSGHTQPIAGKPKSAPEIQALIAAFNRLRERIAGLLTARMALVGGISHDLRTYATRLRLRAEKISDEAERVKAVRDIDDMIMLLDNALLAIKDGNAAKSEELIDLAELLHREVEDRRLQGAQIGLSMHWKSGAHHVLGDSIALRRLISNITENAILYGGSASIRAYSTASEAIIEVEDKGPGIEPELRQQVMEPFVRLESSRNRRTGGAGLGLAIAKNVAETHGGGLSIESAVGGGAKVIITLPLFLPSNT